MEWGNNVLFDVCYIVRSLSLPHIRHAALLYVLLHFHAYVILGSYLGVGVTIMPIRIFQYCDMHVSQMVCKSVTGVDT